ncbi:MAG: gliding motility-associated C-terminal domain-containing protein [Bacteroidia bacterium]|nr:gliding motility-associated C-terminal domain-containing protein [Bacteroidia bacterium]
MIFQTVKQTSLALLLLIFFASFANAQLRVLKLNDAQSDLSFVSESGQELGSTSQKEILIPNAFTPNGDGINDLFVPVYQGEISDYRLVIFDRYGRQIFSANNLNSAWDGTLHGQSVHSGVYIYGITFSDEKGQPQSRSGSITLLR